MIFSLNRKIKAAIYFSIVIVLVSFFWSSVKAQESQMTNTYCEIVLILDASQSMKEVDTQYDALEFVKGLVASLPSHYQIGMVVYQEKILKVVPIGSSYSAIEDGLTGLTYRQYGDAGVALKEACTLFSGEEGEKRIVWISDGELLLSSPEQTQESVADYQQALEEIREREITVDVLALGEQKTEGETIYSAAQLSGGMLQEFATGKALGWFLEDYLFSGLGIEAKQVGSLRGKSGEFTIMLPDTAMDRAKILLLGSQQAESITVNSEAEQLAIYQGSGFTIIDLERPTEKEITIHTQSKPEVKMEMKAWLFIEYSYFLRTEHSFHSDTQMTEWKLMVINEQEETLLKRSAAEGIEILVNEKKQDYQVKEGKAWWEQAYEESTEVTIEVNFPVSGSYYYGNNTVTEEILIPEPEKPQIDWLFWGILILFLIANGGILSLAVKKRRQQRIKPRGITDKGLSLVEKESGKTTFYGKLVVYVIQNKEEIDYPPVSINLFARCNRSVITLEWILDTCSLPLSLKGADQIIFKPGKEKNLIVQNKGKASALKGKELLLKGKAYPVYYHEKITFLFEEEGAEIEVHYKDLKPNER